MRASGRDAEDGRVAFRGSRGKWRIEAVLVALVSMLGCQGIGTGGSPDVMATAVVAREPPPNPAISVGPLHEPGLGSRIDLPDWPRGDGPSAVPSTQPIGRLHALLRPDPEVDWPNIDDPGPDLGNFPNSAFTVPKGRGYVEVGAFTLVGPEPGTPGFYASQFLFRYGLTDDLEFRVLGNGVTAPFGPGAADGGFAPLAVDLKTHFWDARPELLLPAAGLEIALVTELGSRDLQEGLQPSLFLNFDLPLPLGLGLEFNVGATGIENERGQTQYQESFQWSVGRGITERINVFLNGYLNHPGVLHGPAAEDHVVLGAGGFWDLSRRTTLFGSYNFGLSKDSIDYFAQVGFAFAY